MSSNLPDVVMLDNLPTADLEKAIEKLKGRTQIEVSGNVKLEHIRMLCQLGVDYISVGRLTHSVKTLDLSLDFAPNVI